MITNFYQFVKYKVKKNMLDSKYVNMTKYNFLLCDSVNYLLLQAIGTKMQKNYSHVNFHKHNTVSYFKTMG